MLAIPDKGSPDELGAGIAISGGAEIDEHVQVGGRFRLARVTEWTCSGPELSEDGLCDERGYAWKGTYLTLGVELRLRIPLSQRWTTTAGVSVSMGMWSSLIRGDTPCGFGFDPAVDVRIAYRLGRRIGVHLALEEQLQNLGSCGNLAISALWVGLNW